MATVPPDTDQVSTADWPRAIEVAVAVNVAVIAGCVEAENGAASGARSVPPPPMLVRLLFVTTFKLPTTARMSENHGDPAEASKSNPNALLNSAFTPFSTARL